MLGSTWFKVVCATAAALVAVTTAQQTIDQRANDIVEKMTTAQLIGQMTQLNIDTILDRDTGALDLNQLKTYAAMGVGSFLNSPLAGGPKNGKYGLTAQEWRDMMTAIQRESMAANNGHPIIFGVDSVHGANYVSGATIFGQQINAGASFNPDLVFKMGQVTGRDTVAGGMSWIFGPILEIAQNPMWARTYETFGEDPYLVSVMGASIIKGIQNNTAVAACMKHFIGYSKLTTGKDRDTVTLSDFDLLNYFAPPFIAAIKAGALTAMENYISINGVPTVANAKLMKDLLRYDLGFEGFVVTDWEEIRNLNIFHRVAKTDEDAVRLSLTRTTIDMSMVPEKIEFITYAKNLLAANPALLPRIKDSVRRIIKTKLILGLYETPVPGVAEVGKVGQAADRTVANELATESIVLLQNIGNVLPLPSTTAKVFLTGQSAHNIGNLCGGWTLRWQGTPGNSMYPDGISVKMGMEAIGGSSVSFYNGPKDTGENMYDAASVAEAVNRARNADYVVAVIGEETYTEKPGDINDLALPAEQIAFVKALAATGKSVIVVLVSGRPRLLGDLPSTPNVKAIMYAMLPGEQGGKAIAQLLYGQANPSGRLPLTYHKHQGNINIRYNRAVTTTCGDTNVECEVQWPFGTGLSYTTFEYTSLRLSKTTVTGDSDTLTVTVNVRNSGTRAGKETVMLFITQPYREIAVPEVKMLKRFQKVTIAPGVTTTVTFTLDSSDWSVYDPQIGNGLRRYAENGDFIVAIKPDTKCTPYASSLGSSLCARFKREATVNTVTLSATELDVSATESNDGAGTVVAFNG